MTQPADPLAQFQGLVQSLPMSRGNLATVQAYLAQIGLVQETGSALVEAWRNLLDAAPARSPRQQAGSRTTVDENFTAWLKKEDPRVRIAVLGAVYWFGAQTPQELGETLVAHGYRFGASDRGNQIRSAIWKARRDTLLSTRDTNKATFATEEARAKWASHVGIDRFRMRGGAGA